MATPVSLFRLSHLALTLCILSLMQKTAVAQGVTGSLRLTVCDSLGDPISGVQVAVTGAELQGTRGTTSDAKGRCEVLALPPGLTSVRLSHPAYDPVILENARVQLGKSTNLGTVRLHQATHPMPEVVVTADMRNTTVNSTTYGSNLRPGEIDALPLQRNYKDMITMLPLSNLSYYDDGVNIAGATGFENKYFVDGVEVTDPLFQVSSTVLPYNFIREIEVKAGGYDADARSALGGALNVITYSGTNEFHGSVFGFYTNNKFAKDPTLGLADPTQMPFSNYDVGFGLGGPIVRDQLWFYVAYNPTFTRRDVNVPGHGISPDKMLTNSVAGKLTWKAADRLNVTMTITGDPMTQDAVGREVGGVPPDSLITTDSYFQKILEGNLDLSLNGTYMVTENFLIEGVLARVNHYATGDPATPQGASEPFFVDNQTNAWAGGPSSTWDAFRSATMARLVATVNGGGHTVRVGAEYKANSTDNRYRNERIDKYSDTSYQENASAGWQTVHDRIPAVFVQDMWQITRSLSVHAGVRWDGQEVFGSNGALAQKVTLPLQPRVGFVYMPDDQGVHRIFGSFGRYAQEYALGNGLGFSDQSYGYVINYTHDPRVSHAGGDTLPGGGTGTVSAGIDGLRGQYYDDFNLGYQHQFDPTINVRVEGLFRTLREAIDDSYNAAQQKYFIGNPGRGNLSESPRTRRDYLAMVLTVERSGDKHFNFLASYVLSRAYGNYGGLYDPVQQNWAPWAQTSAFDDPNNTRKFGSGLLPNDRTHVLKLAGSYRFDFGFSAGLFFTAQSGTPLNEYAWNGIAAILMAPRGTKGRTKAVWDLNARFAYDLPTGSFARTRLFLDLSHIASQKTAVYLQEYKGNIDANGVYTYLDSNYGVAYRYQPPMSARLGFEVSF
jgi:hypothetical protein